MIFDAFKTKRVTIETMMEKASEWTEIYMHQYALCSDTNVKSAMFVFTSWAVWNYCLQSDKLLNDNIATQYISATLVYSGFSEHVDVIDFVEIFKSRFRIFNQDLTGLCNSKYPNAKQFIPFELYCSIYKNQLSINPTEGVDVNDHETLEAVSEFTITFSQFWNSFSKDIRNSF